MVDANAIMLYTSGVTSYTGRRKRTEKMNERDREICQLVEELGWSYSKVADKYDLTRARVWQIVNYRPHERENNQ